MRLISFLKRRLCFSGLSGLCDRPLLGSVGSLGVAILTSCSAGSAPRQDVLRVSYQVTEDVVFTPKDWPEEINGDIYQPESAVATPAILMIHGGGWTGGDNSGQMKALCRKLASQGYFVFNTTYRLTPKWIHPAQYDDVTEALRWMGAHAERLNIDPTRIGAYGYSAGAHLAALAALKPAPGTPEIQAVVAGGIPSDLMLFEDGKLVRMLIGGPRAGNEAKYRDASPITFVDAKDPPVFLYHGGADTLVPPLHATSFFKKLQENGVESELKILKGKNHIPTFLFPGDTINEAISFLDKHLKS